MSVVTNTKNRLFQLASRHQRDLGAACSAEEMDQELHPAPSVETNGEEGGGFKIRKLHKEHRPIINNYSTSSIKVILLIE